MRWCRTTRWFSEVPRHWLFGLRSEAYGGTSFGWPSKRTRVAGRARRSMRVLVFTIRSTGMWWSYLGRNLTCATSVRFVSDLPDADVNISPDFHTRLRRGGTARWALRRLGETTCDDIIIRCRWLRTLPRDRALAIIGAMWQTLEALFD